VARPRSISDEQIIEAARSAFLDKGMAATTAEIAKLAGVSEGTIFKRFATKNDLFLAAMGMPKVPPFAVNLERRPETGELREELYDICSEIYDFFTELIPKAVMVMSCKISPKDVFAAQGDPAPAKAVRALTNFLVREQKAGRIRNCDPEIVARTLLCAVHFFAWAEHSGVNDRMPLAAQTFIRGLIDVTLSGVEVVGQG